MALNFIAASKGGTCDIIQTGCCMFIPDESANMSSLLHHIRIPWVIWSQTKRFNNKLVVQISGSWWKKLLIIWGITDLICIFCCVSFYCCFGIWVQCVQTATKQATSMLVKPLADCPRHLEVRKNAGARNKKWSVEEVFERRRSLVDLESSIWVIGSSSAFPHLWNVHSTHYTLAIAILKRQSWESNVLLRLSALYVWLNPIKAFI